MQSRDTHRQKCYGKEARYSYWRVGGSILIYLAIPADRNVMPQDVEYEMYDYASNNWGHQNSNKGVNKHLEAKPGTHSIDSPQKIAIIGTLHIIQKVLKSET